MNRDLCVGFGCIAVMIAAGLVGALSPALHMVCAGVVAGAVLVMVAYFTLTQDDL